MFPGQGACFPKADSGAAIATPDETKFYRRASAWFFISLFILLDVLLELVCGRIMLFTYLLVGLFGAWFGKKFTDWLSGAGWGRRLLRGFAVLICVLGLLGAATLTFVEPRWSAHCAHSYCGRAMGPSLFESPFPAGSPSCRALHMCGNEYHHASTPSVRSEIDEMLRERGCEPL